MPVREASDRLLIKGKSQVKAGHQTITGSDVGAKAVRMSET